MEPTVKTSSKNLRTKNSVSFCVAFLNQNFDSTVVGQFAVILYTKACTSKKAQELRRWRTALNRTQTRVEIMAEIFPV